MTRTVIVEFPGNDQFLADQAYLASDGKQRIKTDPRSYEEMSKFWNQDFVNSLIFDEIETNPIDLITVICKDSEELKVSTIILAAISPYLANLFKRVTSEHESKDMLLVLPEVEKNAMIQLVNMAVKGIHSDVTNLAEILGGLDGIFWKLDENDKQIMNTLEKSLEVAEKSGIPQSKTEFSLNDDLISNSDFDLDTYDDIHEFSDDNQSDNETDCDPDFEVVESKPKKYKRRVEVEFEAESEEFFAAQQNLKRDIEDENNLEDPFLLWFKYHDLNPRILYRRNQKKNVKCVCPLCDKIYPYTQRNFGWHLREHKYSNFKCKCESHNQEQQENGGIKTENKEHILLDHWGWKRCSYHEQNNCKAILPEFDYQKHLFTKHKDKEALKCLKCSRMFTYSSRMFTYSCLRNYKKHMNMFHSEPVDDNCDCKDIVFKTPLHRRHHIEVVHKDKFGCDKCYFLSSTQTDLDQHIKIQHNLVKNEDHICDECGSVFKTKRSLQLHMEKLHDPVLIQCTMCPVKMSAGSLKSHVLNMHNKGFCKTCGIQVDNLNKHRENVHYKKLTLKCKLCPDKVFQAKHHLKRHTMSIHLKEKPFNCRFGCDLAYNDACNRNAHERRRHGRLYEVKRNRFSHLNNKCSKDSYKSSRATEVNSANYQTEPSFET